MFGKPARGRAIRETRAFNSAARCRLDRETIDHRLELLAMAYDRSALRTIFAGFMIRDSQNRRAGLSLDQVDRAAQDETAVDRNRVAPAARVAAGRIGQAKCILE